MPKMSGAEMITEAVCFPIERYVRRGADLLTRIDEFLGLDPVAEAARRADLLDETIMLDVLDGVQKRGALPVLRATAARGRLIRAGILRKKTPRAKWKIDPDKDPRTKV